MPEVYTIPIILLELIYYEFFIVKHKIRGNIASNLRQIYTCVSIISLLVSNIILFLNESVHFMLFTTPGFIFVSYIIYKYRVLERIGMVFLLLGNGFIRQLGKIGLIKCYRRIGIAVQNFSMNFKNFKYRKIIIKFIILLGCIGVVAFGKSLEYISLDNASTSILISTILVSFLIYISVGIISYRLYHSNIYHRYKGYALWGSLIITLIVYISIFIFTPQYVIIPVLMIIFFTLVFTKKTDNHDPVERNTRPVVFLLIFAILLPFLVFSISSIVSINNPNIQFAKVPQESRIESPNVDFESLEFYPSINDLEELSFNGMYVTKSRISTLLGESAIMHVRFIPEDVPEVEGRHIREYYDTSSNYNNGPLSNYDLIAPVPLDKLDILPGTYKVEETYSVLTGFSRRNAPPEVYDITIEKDELKSLSN